MSFNNISEGTTLLLQGLTYNNKVKTLKILKKDLTSYNWKYRNKRSKTDFTVGNIYVF